MPRDTPASLSRCAGESSDRAADAGTPLPSEGVARRGVDVPPGRSGGLVSAWIEWCLGGLGLGPGSEPSRSALRWDGGSVRVESSGLTAEYRIEAVADSAAGGCSFCLRDPGGAGLEFCLQVPGRAAVEAGAATAAFLLESGYDPVSVVSVVCAFRGIPGWMQEVSGPGDVEVIYDAAASAEDLQELAAWYRLHPRGSGRTLWLVSSELSGAAQALAGTAGEDWRVVEWGTGAGSALQTTRLGGGEIAGLDLERVESWDRVVWAGGQRWVGEAAAGMAARTAAARSAGLESLRRELESRCAGRVEIRQDEPLARRTTLRVGGVADLWVEPFDEDALSAVAGFCRERRIPMTVLGRGSNLLVRDAGIRGVVVSLGRETFSKVEVRGDRVVAGAGARLKTVAQEARRQGLAGLEFLEGIPGSVGGALRMNAGAMGASMFGVVERVRCMDRAGRVMEFGAAEVPVEYRNCPLFRTHTALGATLRGTVDASEAVAARMAAYSAKRWETQPKEPSAGCMFKNPEGQAAGRLIDELGLKGTRVGRARVSDVHGNFMVNDGGATAGEVLALIEVVRRRVRRLRGVALRTEVELAGEPGPDDSVEALPD